MDDFFNAPFPAIRGQAPDLIPIVNNPEEEIFIPQNGRLLHLWDGRLMHLGFHVERIFEPVLQNPDEYLMPRYAPFEELPAGWEAFSGNNYLGLQQHYQEELDAPEEVEDMDDEEEDFPENDDLGVQPHLPEESEAPEQEEDMDNEEEDMDDEDEPSPEDVDAMSSAPQPVAKRAHLATDDLMLKDIGSSSSSVSTFGLQESAMPDASPAAFGSILEPVTTSETLNI